MEKMNWSDIVLTRLFFFLKLTRAHATACNIPKLCMAETEADLTSQAEARTRRKLTDSSN